MNKKVLSSEEEAMKLWERVFDWIDDPFLIQCNYADVCCFLCDEEYPNHISHCIWIKAKELVQANRK